ncbi:hypothetical protein HUK78_07870 [Pseudomonas aeruginosa]|uniref:hypothetical protein n=1 Tax=Pseudomonas aeruginosa TaxID=287 RepID=UPI001F387354|nr:hypothetical protein [Pseudomonas aeruginosa]UJC34514.1 hypothetical protein HUK78_07560 [Pseudomonas aeruginosa]UJC34572.1 hypothetical protein HUK78_07870 [Pseudomonas aeruginosa]
MTESKICTCPSGDGSMRWPCPKHPAVEHERAEFEAWVRRDWPGAPLRFIRDALPVNDPRYGQYCDDALQRAWVGWQARAALAQPSPVSEALIYACKNLAQITSSDGSGHADIAMAVLRMAGVGDDERERLVNEWKAARAWKPSPAQAEAEVERLDWSSALLDVAVLQEALTSRDSDERMKNMDAGEVIRRAFGKLKEIRAQHERIVGALRFERQQMDRAFTACINERDAANARLHEVATACATAEQERDAALARVAELEAKLADLEKQEPIGWFAQYCETPMRRMVQWGTKVPDCAADTFYPLYAAPVAQAQHGVPGKYDDVLLPFLKLMEHELHANAGKGDRPGWLQMDRKTALLEIYYHLGKLQKATRDNDPAGIVEYAADVANMAMMLVDVCRLLAAAPGKEVGHE